MRTSEVWNKAAREQLFTNKPSWLEKIKQDLSPGAIWKIKNAGTILFLEPPSNLEPPTERVLSRTAKLCRLFKDLRNTLINANIDDTKAIHYTARSPLIMYNKSAC